MQSKTTTNTLTPRNTKPSFSTCPRSIFQTSKAGLLADCVEQCSCGCAFSSFRSMTSASASQNTVMAVAPDSNRLSFSPGRVLRAPCMRIELWPYYSAMGSVRQSTSPVRKRKRRRTKLGLRLGILDFCLLRNTLIRLSQ
jgi:hypothetical protein